MRSGVDEQRRLPAFDVDGVDQKMVRIAGLGVLCKSRDGEQEDERQALRTNQGRPNRAGLSSNEHVRKSVHGERLGCETAL